MPVDISGKTRPDSHLARGELSPPAERCGIGPGQIAGGTLSDLRYDTPESLAAAVGLFMHANRAARVLISGTDDVVQADLIEPELLVDIEKTSELRVSTPNRAGFGPTPR